MLVENEKAGVLCLSLGDYIDDDLHCRHKQEEPLCLEKPPAI